MNHATIDLWTADLDRPAALTPRELRRLLSSDEIERAERLLSGPVRDRWVAARTWLRRVLAKYVDTPAGELRFVYGDNGKPAFDPSITAAVHFNLSHSAHVAALGVTRHGPLGVDIEQIRDRRYMAKIVTRFFSADEVTRWRQLPRDQQVAGFFNCWTRKEAYIKAIGTGLHTPLDSFNVSLAPGEPVRLLSVDGVADVSHWHMCQLEVPDGFAGALAMEGVHDVSIVHRELESDQARS